MFVNHPAARWLLVTATFFSFLELAPVVSAKETGAVTSPVFHPSAFPKSIAECKGLNRKEGVEKDLEIRASFLSPSIPSQISFSAEMHERSNTFASIPKKKSHIHFTQTMSTSTLQQRRQLSWCTDGPVYGRIGAIRFWSFR